MVSSDDENNDVPEFVTTYFFEDEKDEPISFSSLPITWSTNQTNTQSLEKQIYVRGFTSDGLGSVHKRVSTWKFDISGKVAEISVLTRDNNWIKLMKPRPSYRKIIRTVLITVNFLHLVKRNPEMSGKAIWDRLSQTLSLYDEPPSKSDLGHHKSFIEEAVHRDASLKKSKYLMAFFEKNQHVKEGPDKGALTKKEFIVDDDDDSVDESDDEEDGPSETEENDDEHFDSVCCICDNGGDILCCEGICMRSFHATRKAAEEAFADDPESMCVSLGLSEAQVKAMPVFKCENCKYMRHQCFACGKLGSSDKSMGAEVFQCVNGTCGYFYHPHCVAKLLNRDSEIAAKELQDKILAGESFTCPHHVCAVCKKPEDKSDPKLQMAVCRRCPKAYHEKCLPSKIAFVDNEEYAQRAWRDLLVDRILMYCVKHEIDDDLGTPRRNHIKFPDVGRREKRSPDSSLIEESILSEEKPSVHAASLVGTTIQRKNKALPAIHGKRDVKTASNLNRPPPLKKEASQKKSGPVKIAVSSKPEEHEISLGDQLFNFYSQQSGSMKPSKSNKLTEEKVSKFTKPAVKKLDLQLDSDSERRILDLMEEASSFISLDDIIQNHEHMISSREYKQKLDSNKSITEGKVERYCEAIREAAKKVDGGGSIGEAKSFCEQKVLSQVDKWKDRLRVYLGPFLHGKRYTSYGRLFTKIDKLKEIVDKIHSYVGNGDTIVDFCCGSNDFSFLMKEKLEKMGKTCSYKNYDLFPPKNDFAFEKRDWMTVEPRELPPGSQLVMGLNPPFGVRASLANRFINKALQFKPKLLILIVPPETERLDEKALPYDLIWEDTELLSGKSFYLPGSVDVKDQQVEDWNVVAPVLYLWSHPDWANKHKAIAEKHGHLHVERGREQDPPASICDQKIDVTNADNGSIKKDLREDGKETPTPRGTAEKRGRQSVGNNRGGEKRQGSTPKDLSDTRREKPKPHGTPEDREHQSVGNDRGGEKRPTITQENKRGSQELRKVGDGNYKRQRSSPGNPHHGGSRNLSGDSRDWWSALEAEPSGEQQSPSDMDMGSPTLEQRASHPPDLDFGQEGNVGAYPYDRRMNHDPETDAYACRESWSNQAPQRDYGQPSPVSAHQPLQRDYGRPSPASAYQPPQRDFGLASLASAPRRDYGMLNTAEWRREPVREHERFGHDLPSFGRGSDPRGIEPTYNIGDSFTRSEYTSASQRYSFGPHDPNRGRMGGYGTPPMGQGSGVGGFLDYNPPSHQVDPTAPQRFARGPVEPYPRGGLHPSASGGWLP